MHSSCYWLCSLKQSSLRSPLHCIAHAHKIKKEKLSADFLLIFFFYFSSSFLFFNRQKRQSMNQYRWEIRYAIRVFYQYGVLLFTQTYSQVDAIERLWTIAAKSGQAIQSEVFYFKIIPSRLQSPQKKHNQRSWKVKEKFQPIKLMPSANISLNQAWQHSDFSLTCLLWQKPNYLWFSRSKPSARHWREWAWSKKITRKNQICYPQEQGKE